MDHGRRRITRSSSCSVSTNSSSMSSTCRRNSTKPAAGSDALVYRPRHCPRIFRRAADARAQRPRPALPDDPDPRLPLDRPVTTPSLLGGTFNLLSHKLLQNIMWMASGEQPVKRFWRQKFGQIPEDFGNPFPRQTLPAYPTIVSCQITFSPPQATSPRTSITAASGFSTKKRTQLPPPTCWISSITDRRPCTSASAPPRRHLPRRPSSSSRRYSASASAE